MPTDASLLIIDVDNPLSTAHSTEPWEKQEEETPKSFGAFKVYRDLPVHNRSMLKAARQIYGDTVKLHQLKQFEKWSRRFHWVARSLAWDEELDRQGRYSQIRAVREMNSRNAKIAQALISKAVERLKTVDSESLTLDDILRFIAEGSKLERQALGEPDEVIELHNQSLSVNIDYSIKTDEELKRAIATQRARFGLLETESEPS